jgi:hypothetical protein
MDFQSFLMTTGFWLLFGLCSGYFLRELVGFINKIFRAVFLKPQYLRPYHPTVKANTQTPATKANK